MRTRHKGEEKLQKEGTQLTSKICNTKTLKNETGMKRGLLVTRNDLQRHKLPTRINSETHICNLQNFEILLLLFGAFSLLDSELCQGKNWRRIETLWPKTIHFNLKSWCQRYQTHEGVYWILV